MQTWTAQNRVELRFIQPDIESFNGKLRGGCLSVEWFRSRAEAKVVIETWRLHFNAIRPHSSLELLDAVRVQAAASPHPKPRRPPGMIGSNSRGRSASYKDAKDYQKR
jgi:putative transposase